MIKIFFLLFLSFAIFRIYRYNIPQAFGQIHKQKKRMIKTPKHLKYLVKIL